MAFLYSFHSNAMLGVDIIAISIRRLIISRYPDKLKSKSSLIQYIRYSRYAGRNRDNEGVKEEDRKRRGRLKIQK